MQRTLHFPRMAPKFKFKLKSQCASTSKCKVKPKLKFQFMCRSLESGTCSQSVRQSVNILVVPATIGDLTLDMLSVIGLRIHAVWRKIPRCTVWHVHTHTVHTHLYFRAAPGTIIWETIQYTRRCTRIHAVRAPAGPAKDPQVAVTRSRSSGA